MSPLWVEGATLRRELPLSLIAVGALAALTFDREVSTVDAVLLLVLAAVVIGYLVYVGLRDREAAERLRSEVADYEAEGTPSVGSSSLLAVGGLLGTLAGAQILITGATGLARIIGISEAAIGLTIVAVGTSLPELVTAVVASRKNENDLVVGNILGSNIFNALPVAGVAGLLDTLELDPAFPASVAVMVAAVGLTAVFLFTGNRLGRREGAVLLVAFVAATVFVF
jgi:cation:H+ antiporter